MKRPITRSHFLQEDNGVSWLEALGILSGVFLAGLLVYVAVGYFTAGMP